MDKIDVHMHVSLKKSEQEQNGVRFACAEEMLPVMDKYGIKKSILMSLGEKDVLMNNEEIRGICRKYPERFCYLAMFDLHNEENLESRIVEEKKLGAKGIGECTPEERNAYPEGAIEKEGRVQELLRKYPNLYADLSANSGGNAVMRDAEYGYGFLEEFQDQLMYGTDLFSIDQYFPLGDFLDKSVERKKISQEAYHKITRGNAIKIFKL